MFRFFTVPSFHVPSFTNSRLLVPGFLVLVPCFIETGRKYGSFRRVQSITLLGMNTQEIFKNIYLWLYCLNNRSVKYHYIRLVND